MTNGNEAPNGWQAGQLADAPTSREICAHLSRRDARNATRWLKFGRTDKGGKGERVMSGAARIGPAAGQRVACIEQAPPTRK